MIPKPNLDDRTHKEIVEEAIRLLPQYCPEWSNHNPNDPGIALIELFAWMMEMGLYRLNKVTDKTYLTLMELIGMRLQSAQPAKTLVSFTMADGKKLSQRIPANIQVATVQSEDSDPVVFETQRALLVNNINLVSCISTEADRMSDNTDILCNSNSEAAFPIFQSHTPIERYIYMGDPSIGLLKGSHQLKIYFRNSHAQWPDMTRLLTWEYFNGHRWVKMSENPRPLTNVMERNQVEFQGPLSGISPTSVNEKEACWIRAALKSKPEHRQQTLLNTAELQISMQENGVVPDLCLANVQSMMYEPLDLTKDFLPFMGQPKYNDAFFIASKEIFSKPGSKVQVQFALSQNPKLAKPEASEDLVLSWEYWDGQQWRTVGCSNHEKKEEPDGEYAFLDQTGALTDKGVVSFTTPQNWQSCAVNNQENYWLRVRIHTGDFGVGGQYVQSENKAWVWEFDRPFRPPTLSRLTLSYQMPPMPCEHLITYNDFKYQEHTARNLENFQKSDDRTTCQEIVPFTVHNDRNPMCCFGFDKAFPQEDNQLYFLLKDQENKFTESMAQDMLPGSSSVSVVWEYWNGTTWRELTCQDHTLGLSSNGFLYFQGPKDIIATEQWGQKLFWLRARHEMGTYERIPYLSKIFLNTVEAVSQRTISNEVLGSSNGTPNQAFGMMHTPVINTPEVWVAENEMPSQAIVRQLGSDAIYTEADSEKQRIWVRWQAQDGFYESTPFDRHFVCDPVAGKIRFGDGQHGHIPCEGKNNIRISRYCVGGGSDCNVGANTITVLKKSVPFVSKVSNPVAAAGGADAENIKEAQMRAPHLFKHRFRAVTNDDFEWLAKEASNQVARAKCLPSHRQAGEVTVVVVPKVPNQGTQLGDRIEVSQELLRRVHAYLDDRRLLTTQLQVTGFQYVDISLQVEVVLRSTLTDSQSIKSKVEEKIRTFLHPLYGGPDGQGWPFGMAISKSDVHMALEKVEGIYYVSGVRIKDEDRDVEVEKVFLPKDAFAYPMSISVIERLAV
jgi:Baseplate J-like protein